jgi:plasmid stabilization system protein ParE
VTYRLFITEKAAAEVRGSYQWKAERDLQAADRWWNAIVSAMKSLTDNPERCAGAPEEEWYGHGLRQLLVGKRSGMYRILFVVRGDTVTILRVRHAAQDLLRRGDLDEPGEP